MNTMNKDNMPKVGEKFRWKYTPTNMINESICYEVVTDSNGLKKYYIDPKTEKVRILVPETDVIEVISDRV